MTINMTLKTYIRRHPVTSYFTLAFTISWVAIFAVAWPKFSRGEAMGFKEALLMFLPTLAGPSIAGIALMGVADGSKGLRNLFSRMGRCRVGGQWYSAILIFPVLILAILLGLTSLVSSDFAPYFFPTGIAIGLLAGFLEEIGWMGYAFPKMQLRHSALTAAILLGVIHAGWHLAPDYLGASVARGTYWLPHYTMFAISMTAMRVLIVWIYTNTRSLMLAQLMHASSTGFLSVLVPLSLSPANDTLFYAVYAVVLWFAVAIVVARYGKQLIQKPS